MSRQSERNNFAIQFAVGMGATLVFALGTVVGLAWSGPNPSIKVKTTYITKYITVPDYTFRQQEYLAAFKSCKDAPDNNNTDTLAIAQCIRSAATILGSH